MSAPFFRQIRSSGRWDGSFAILDVHKTLTDFQRHISVALQLERHYWAEHIRVTFKQEFQFLVSFLLSLSSRWHFWIGAPWNWGRIGLFVCETLENELCKRYFHPMTLRFSSTSLFSRDSILSLLLSWKSHSLLVADISRMTIWPFTVQRFDNLRKFSRMPILCLPWWCQAAQSESFIGLILQLNESSLSRLLGTWCEWVKWLQVVSGWRR